MGLLALHGYLTPSQPPERALQEQIAERFLALHVIICIPCPQKYCYSGSHDAYVFLTPRWALLWQKMGPGPLTSSGPNTTHWLLPTPLP